MWLKHENIVAKGHHYFVLYILYNDELAKIYQVYKPIQQFITITYTDLAVLFIKKDATKTYIFI